MKKLLRLLVSLWHLLLGKPSDAVKSFSKPTANKGIAAKRKKKKVSEMNDKERTWYFAEQRFEWLIKHGYNSRIHVPSDPKPDPSPSHYRATLLKIAKICSDRGERNINRAKKKGFEGKLDRSDVNKHGIRMANYGL